MDARQPLTGEFSRQDIAFLIGETDPRLLDRIDIISSDRAFVSRLLEDRAPQLMQRIMLMSTDTVLVSVTPRFLFDVLLRSARRELATRPYTIERSARQRLPVFDAVDATGFISDDAVLTYLARMLTSFTHIRSFSWPVRVRKGIWRRIRFNDMDIDSLLRFCRSVDEDQRFDLYRRIADLCLFTLGMFPEYVVADMPGFPGKDAPVLFGRRARSAADYEEEGRRFYRLASEHPQATLAGARDVLLRLHRDFHLARKPLNFLSERYLQFKKGQLFPHAGQ